jgi:hypothetical protein
MRPLLTALCLIAGVSAAQAQQPPADPISTLTEDWNAYQNAQRHVVVDLSAMATELQKARADLVAVTKERDELKAQLEKLKQPAALPQNEP